MQGIMYAAGPDIQDAESIKDMKMVDHYQIFCDLLGLSPKPNNGSEAILKDILTKYEAEDDSQEDGDDDDNKKDNDSDEKDDDDDDDDNGGVALGMPANSWLVCVALLLTHLYIFL